MTVARPGIDDRLLVGTGRRALDVPVTWWRPDRPAPGTVWLQHGFARSRRRMAFLAAGLVDAGLTVVATSLRSADRWRRTVNHLGDNGPFLDDLAAALAATASGPWVAVGHSAGGDAAARVAAAWPPGTARLAGVVLLDPVPGPSGGHLRAGVRALTSAGTPIRLVAAPASRCNAGGAGLRQVLPELPGFAGVMLMSGSHADAEGPGTDRWAQWACGRVSPENAAAVRDLTSCWAAAMVQPDDAAIAEATPALVDHLVAAGRARPL